MTSFLIWLVVVEVLGLAVAPLAFCALARLPDRGYGLSKILGVLLVTFLNYLFGSTFGQGNNAVLLGLAMILVFGLGVFALGEERARLGLWLREHRAVVIVQEALFISLFALWTIVRANHPAVLSTEKPMDLAMMTASHMASSFPPYDPWMAGTTINYYYGGYLAIGTLVTLTGVLPAIGYNLGTALIFALVGLGVYSVMYNLTRSVVWALLAPVFTILIGNLDWLHQAMSAPPGASAFSSFNFFNSSRVVDPVGARTITEFPAFSFVLGDLHPHVIALPFTVLSAGVALNFALAPEPGWNALGANHLRRALALIIAGAAVGALYFDNSWDWPSYLLLVMAGLLIPGLRGLRARLLGQAAGLALGVAILSYLLFVQFRGSFQPQYNAVGFKLHGSLTSEVFIMFGLFLVPIGLYLVTLLAQPSRALASGLPTGGKTSPRQRSTAASLPGSARATTTAAVTVKQAAATPAPSVAEDGAEWDDELPLLPMPRFLRRERGTKSVTTAAPMSEAVPATPAPNRQPAAKQTTKAAPLPRQAAPTPVLTDEEDGDDGDLPRLPTLTPTGIPDAALVAAAVATVLIALIAFAAGSRAAGIILLAVGVGLGAYVVLSNLLTAPRDVVDDGEDDEEAEEPVDEESTGAPVDVSPLIKVGGLLAGALLSWGFFALLGIGDIGLLLPFAGVALYLAWHEGSAGRNGAALACLLCAGGLLLVMACDVVYLKDIFCGVTDSSGTCTGDLYRMNTVFKLYYQAWTLLSLGAVFALWSLSRLLRRGWRRAVAPTLAGLLVLFGAPYIPLSLSANTGDLDTYTNPVPTTNPTLDASAFLAQYSGQPISITNALPNDYAAILWLRSYVAGHPTVLEADEDPTAAGNPPLDYEPFPGASNQELAMSRISTFTGLASVLGSGGSHEGLWHGGQAATNTFYNVGTRTSDIRTMYTSTDLATVGADLAKYGVTYVYFGGAEDYVYFNNNQRLVNAAVDRFKHLHYKVVYTLNNVTILRR